MNDRAATPAAVDVTRAHPTRAVNYLLGGKDNFAVDRAAADAAMVEQPLLPKMARAHVRFRQRIVRHLAVDAGIRQFLLFDGGYPHALDLHEIAQAVDPTARIGYVATDPVVAAHSRALLASDPRGAVLCLHSRPGHPAAVLDDPDLAATFDLDRPIAVTMSTTLMNMSDDRACGELGRLRAAAAAGSHLALSQLSADGDPDAIAHVVKDLANNGVPHPVRSREQLAALFAGWDLVAPGVVSILDWHPTFGVTAAGRPARRARNIHIVGGLARKHDGP